MIAVSGSIATDHLMRFPGRFAEQLIAGSLDTVSLSFLVDDLVVRRGGVAANIAFGLAQLGHRPVLLGAVGGDFGDYRSWLERHGVDCSEVQVSSVAHTARFICTTDTDLCQIASFYPGAMGEPDRISLDGVAARAGGLGLVILAAENPDTMLARAAACRRLGLPFAADPSQQLARMPSADIEAMINGARYLLTNEYEAALLESKTGLSEDDILRRVGVRVVTLGANGVRITGQDGDFLVPAAQVGAIVDPTGVGDGFRAGFFAALAADLPIERAAQVGCVLAAHVLEVEGPQEYTIDADAFERRLAESYGSDVAVDVRALGLARV
ncbi:carbohydrate kinase family protein [Micromonospora sp. NIE79]|uniref:Carbohydrate kinase family protein n=1 Tax=Micromonospora trifolii TaxID=2911208 RepID=A0ABS9NBB1_9ACTN|nr:carbohydrate kinase family protein [Micromonospora trifolii]MCG5447243.1 carbohydrate kinase family protein [Micromonospora trifolii]